MFSAKLVEERAGLLARIEQINEALALLGNPAKPVEIGTRRNLRNTPVGYPGSDDEWVEVKVYSDSSLTVEASDSDHGGWITSEDAAQLKNAGEVDDDFLALYEEQ